MYIIVATFIVFYVVQTIILFISVWLRSVEYYIISYAIIPVALVLLAFIWPSYLFKKCTDYYNVNNIGISFISAVAAIIAANIAEYFIWYAIIKERPLNDIWNCKDFDTVILQIVFSLIIFVIASFVSGVYRYFHHD